MRTLAIGDIHGCHTALVTLLDRVKPLPDDQLIFLGDYIDRGPQSRQVIELLIELGKSGSAVFLRGNHEAMILNAREGLMSSESWQICGGLETVVSYGSNYRDEWASFIPDSHWNFYERTQRFFETDTHIFVHAGVDAKLDLNDQNEDWLFWETFEQMTPHKSGKRIVCGHTNQRSGKINYAGFAVCIDTGCATGGWLTCLDVHSGKFWQANDQGESRDGMLVNPEG